MEFSVQNKTKMRKNALVPDIFQHIFASFLQTWQKSNFCFDKLIEMKLITLVCLTIQQIQHSQSDMKLI